MYDFANIKKLKTLGELAPGPMKAFNDLNAAVFTEGALSVKVKELIALAVGFTTQCPYCIEIHNRNARKAGATEAEIAEAALVAAALRAGGAVTHATHAIG